MTPREWLAEMETDIAKGEWRDPERAEQLVTEYAATWIKERPGLRPRTIELYEGLLRRHIAPYFAGVTLAKIDNNPARDPGLAGGAAVGRGVGQRLGEGVPAAAGGAAHGGRRRRDPAEPVPDQAAPTRSTRPSDRRSPPAQVAALARRMPPRLVALVMLGTYASLRWGELAALRRGRPGPDRGDGPDRADAGRGRRPGDRGSAQVPGRPARRRLPAGAGAAAPPPPRRVRRGGAGRARLHRSRRVPGCAGTTSASSSAGRRRSRRSARRGCTSTTCGTPATRSRPRFPGPRSGT